MMDIDFVVTWVDMDGRRVLQKPRVPLTIPRISFRRLVSGIMVS